jgi:hypothetical protein
MVFFMTRKEKKALLHTETYTNLLYWGQGNMWLLPTTGVFTTFFSILVFFFSDTRRTTESMDWKLFFTPVP